MYSIACLKYLILDMDGVLWRGDTPLPGLCELFITMQQCEIDYLLATNNASKTPQQYVQKLGTMGVKITEDRIITSALATASILANQSTDTSRRVYMIGGEGLKQALTVQGFTIAERFDHQSPVDYVVVGFNQDATYRDFATATLQIRKGATFIGTNADPTFPTEQGQIPGNGAFLALLQASTQTQAMVMGKPELPMFHECLKKFGIQANGQNTAMVGDRLDTDIVGGKRAGLQTILVQTGVTQRDELEASIVAPDYIVSDLFGLIKLIKTHSA